MSSAASPTKFYEACLTFFPFSMPTMKVTAADYKASFKTYMATSEDTNQLILRLMSTRSDLIKATSPGSGIPLEHQIPILDAYLKEILSLHESLTTAIQQNQVITCDKEINFEWNLFLTEREPYKSPSMIFEMVMLLHMKAILHYRFAMQLLQTDLMSFITEAGKQLSYSQACFDKLATNLSTDKWYRTFNPKIANPAETQPLVCSGLSLYIQTKLQMIAAIKALIDNKMSAAMKARLFLAVASYASSGIDVLTQAIPATTKNILAWMNPVLFAFLGGDREVSKAIAYWQHTLMLSEKTELGQALYYAQVVKLLLQEQSLKNSSAYDARQGGLPKVNHYPSAITMPQMKVIVNYLLEQMKDPIAQWDRDNRLIYFQGTPTPEELIPIGAELKVKTAQLTVGEYGEEVKNIPFIEPVKPPSFFRSLFGKSSSSANVGKDTDKEGKEEKEGDGKEEDGGTMAAADGSTIVAAAAVSNEPPAYNNAMFPPQPPAADPAGPVTTMYTPTATNTSPYGILYHQPSSQPPQQQQQPYHQQQQQPPGYAPQPPYQQQPTYQQQQQQQQQQTYQQQPMYQQQSQHQAPPPYGAYPGSYAQQQPPPSMVPPNAMAAAPYPSAPVAMSPGSQEFQTMTDEAFARELQRRLNMGDGV